MEQGKKGIELILIGLLITLPTNFLCGLDTGIWLSAIVFCVEALAMVFVAAGLGHHDGQSAKWGRARGVALANLVLCLALAGLIVWSGFGTTALMAIVASTALIGNGVLGILLVGLILMGLADDLKESGSDEAAKKAGLIWWWFFSLTLLCLAAKIAAILLVNQAIPVLTYLVLAAGVPPLAMGAVAIIFIYRHV